MEEIIRKSRDKENYPDDEEEFLNSSREFMHHENYGQSR
jgi:hypothetical protein